MTVLRIPSLQDFEEDFLKVLSLFLISKQRNNNQTKVASLSKRYHGEISQPK